MERWFHFQGTLASYLSTISHTEWKQVDASTGETFLHIAVWVNDLTAAKMLIGHVSIDSQDRRGNTPLHLACRLGVTAFVRFLCEANATVNIVATDDLTPADIAISFWGFLPLASILMLYGAILPRNVRDDKILALQTMILNHRYAVYTLLFIAKNKKRDYRWDRFLLHKIARQVWELRFEAAGY